MGGITGGQKTTLLVFTRQKHARVGHKDPVENDHAGRLAIFRGEFCRALTGSTCGPGHDGNPRCVNRHGTGHGEIGIFFRVSAAGHHQKLMHIGGAGDNRLGAADHNPVHPTLHDMHIGIRIFLLPRSPGAVALGIGHRYAQGEVALLNIVQIVEKTRMVIGTVIGVCQLG